MGTLAFLIARLSLSKQDSLGHDDFMKIQWEYDLVERHFCKQLKAMGCQWKEMMREVVEWWQGKDVELLPSRTTGHATDQELLSGRTVGRNGPRDLK